MPRRMSVWPTANHTRTPEGTRITVVPMPPRQQPPKRAAPTPGSGRGHGRQIRSRSPAAAAGRPCRRQTVPSAPAQSRSPPLANPAASGRSNSMSRRPSAPHRVPPHRAQTPPRPATIACFCSLLHRRRRSGLASTSMLATTPVSCTGANTAVCTDPYQPDQLTDRKPVPAGRLPLNLERHTGNGTETPP